VKPLISYIIASVQRSGTHLLGSILRSTGVAGRPGEHFFCKRTETWEERWGSPSRAAYVERMLRQGSTPNGVFGFVAMWTYFERIIDMLHQIPAYQRLDRSQVLNAVFNQPKYIWMRRRNRLQQAVSWAIASQTKVWSKKPGDAMRQSQQTLQFDFKLIDQRYNQIVAEEEDWENYFRKEEISPLVLFYEDVAASNRDAAQHVLEYLGVPFPSGLDLATPAVEKQATEMSEQWAARYLELKAKMTGARMTKPG
jgi:trehalose 2-sulfotransferase